MIKRISLKTSIPFLLLSSISLGLLNHSNIAIAEAVKFANQDNYEVYATIVPINQAQISSEITAKIDGIYFRPGQEFIKGDKLVSFDCKTTEIKIEKIKAVLKGTKVNLESNQKLKKLDSISNVELKESESKHEEQLAELHLLENEASKCNIIAPYNGEVTAVSAFENEIIKTDDPLIEIVSNHDLEVQMFIPSNWLNMIKVGTNFKLKISEVEHSNLPGTVSKIVSKVDTSSQSILVFGKLDQGENNPINLFAGMSGVAAFEISKDNE